MQHRVGIISDTHIPHFRQLPEAVWAHFAEVELIIHAGDLSVLSVIAELETIAPVVAVQGNIEHEEVVLKLPIKREVVVGQCRIGVVHILGESARYAKTARREFPRRASLSSATATPPTIRSTTASCSSIPAAPPIDAGSRRVVLVCCISMTRPGACGVRLLSCEASPSFIPLLHIYLNYQFFMV